MADRPEPRRRTFTILMCLTLWAAVVSTASAMDDAARQAELERIKRNIAVTQERIVDAYIAEQTPGKTRAEIQLIVGVLYDIGQLGEPDPVKAAKYYEDAAAGGSVDAVCALGHVYDIGAKTATGEIRRDPVRARALFEQAAAGGSVRAMVELGVIYADGRDVDPDSKKALEYFREAGTWGDPTALERLEPVMRKAREWEAAKAERKGKAGFPTSKEELVDKGRVERFIDVGFNQQKLASAVFVEIGRRLMVAMKKEQK